MRLKHLFGLLAIAAATTLVACQSDEDDSVKTACFASEASPGDTRTSLDKDVFYWTSGDRIFVKNGTAYVKSDNAVTGTAAGANFYLTGTFNSGTGYPVVYTGNGDNTSPTSVTIKADQSQPTANDATHIGTDGDCGNATASYTGVSSYAFWLNHRASYLRIAPRHELSGVSSVVLKSVKVETPAAGTDYIRGTYTFSENTVDLASETISNPGKDITLTVGGWPVPSKDDADADDSLLDKVRGYMVIQPGTHTLTFTYTVRVDSETSDRTFTKTVTNRSFVQGTYTEVKHILK